MQSWAILPNEVPAVCSKSSPEDVASTEGNGALSTHPLYFRPEAEGRGRFYTPFCPGLGGPVTSDVPFAGPCHWPLFSFARPLLSLSNHFRCVFLPSTVPVHSVFLLSTPPVQPHLSHRSTNTSCFVPRRASSLFPRVDLSRA
jgi:hypothetical protein